MINFTHPSPLAVILLTLLCVLTGCHTRSSDASNSVAQSKASNSVMQKGWVKGHAINLSNLPTLTDQQVKIQIEVTCDAYSCNGNNGGAWHITVFNLTSDALKNVFPCLAVLNIVDAPKMFCAEQNLYFRDDQWKYSGSTIPPGDFDEFSIITEPYVRTAEAGPYFIYGKALPANHPKVTVDVPAGKVAMCATSEDAMFAISIAQSSPEGLPSLIENGTIVRLEEGTPMEIRAYRHGITYYHNPNGVDLFLFTAARRDDNSGTRLKRQAERLGGVGRA